MNYDIILISGDRMEKQIRIKDLKAMQDFAKEVNQHLFSGFVLCLSGDLGAGKTTFTQFLGESMGIQDAINSPTFTLMKIYEHTLPLYHIDAYRLEGVGSDQQLEEYIYGNGVCVIEWYEYIINSIPKACLMIDIEWVSQDERLLRLKGSGMYETIIEKLGD